MRSKKGFTLIEVLLVIAVIGLLAAILTMRAVNISSIAKNRQAEMNLKILKTAVESYAIDNGQIPVTANFANGLESTKTRLVSSIPSDPWNPTAQLQYITDGGSPPTYYAIWSVGSSGTGSVSVTTTGNGTATATGSPVYVSNCAVNNNNLP